MLSRRVLVIDAAAFGFVLVWHRTAPLLALLAATHAVAAGAHWRARARAPVAVAEGAGGAGDGGDDDDDAHAA